GGRWREGRVASRRGDTLGNDPWIVGDDSVDTAFDEGSYAFRLGHGPDENGDPECVTRVDRTRRDDAMVERRRAGADRTQQRRQPTGRDRAQRAERERHGRS